MNKIECVKCGHKSLKFDNFMDLSVSFPRKSVKILGYISVEECLKNFITPERMEVCGYRCTGCKREDNFVKDMTIYRLPRILVIHLKRFYNSYIRREKLNTSVKIPETLDMAPFAPHSGKSDFNC